MARERLQHDEHARQAITGLRNLVETMTPWLFEVGSWICGGLTAFNLLVIASLIAAGPVDTAIRIAVAAFACALPLNVAGIFFLRLIKDLKDIGIDDLALKAFEDAGFTDIHSYFPPAQARQALLARRSQLALRYSLPIVALSTAFMLIGLAAAFWHMGWWISLLFAAMVVAVIVFVAAAMAHTFPPESEAEKALKRRGTDGRSAPRPDQ